VEEAYKRSFRGQSLLRRRRRRFANTQRRIKVRCSFVAVGMGPTTEAISLFVPGPHWTMDFSRLVPSATLASWNYFGISGPSVTDVASTTPSSRYSK
jgi:hypothetical protein